MSEIIARYEINLKAIIEHTKDSDNTNITCNSSGQTSQAGFQKIILEAIAFLGKTYTDTRKDMWIRGEKI